MNMQTHRQAFRVSFSQAGTANTSMSFVKSNAEQPSFVETASSRYNLEPYGLVQPLQVREVLKTSRDNVATVQLHSSGWALLVIKTKIYLWRHVGKSQICKEFVVPLNEANEDQLNTDLVCFYPPPPSIHTTSFPRHIGLVAVSPTGVVFSWSNILQHDKVKGYVEKLVVDGGGAHSLQCIPEVGCLLATKDCRYFIITPTTHQGHSSITVKQLSSGGMISGFARRFSSVWFQSSNEVSKVLRKVVVTSFMDNKCVYALTDTRIEKWSIGQNQQQIYDVLLESLLADKLASLTEGVDNLSIEYVDLKVINDQVLILVAMVNSATIVEESTDDTNKMATLATAVLTADTPSPRLQQIMIINSEVIYQDDNDLFKWHLVHETCCHDNKNILSIHGTHYDRLECRQDKIIGSGYFDEHSLLFLAKAGVMRLQLKSLEVSKYSTPAAKKVKKHSMRRSLLPQEMPIDDHLNVLKKAFQCYCESNSDEAHLLLQQKFFQSFSQRQYQGSDTYGDIATIEISSLLIDDIPDADPRWAENQCQDSSNTNTIILYQLEDKLIAHERLMQFFIDTGILARLTFVTVHGRRLRTVDHLSEHGEKLVVAMTMKQLPNETFDGAIGLIMESRRSCGITIKPNLTLQDLFYREVSCIDEIFKALLEDEEQRLRTLTDHNSRIRLVSTVLSAYETILHESCQRRHSKYSFYHAADVTVDGDAVEFLPWTATDHVRQLVTRQLDIVVRMGIQETSYQHKELLWQSFVALIDIILTGYCEQIDSIRDIDKRKEINSMYECEKARMLQLLTHIGLYNSVITLAEKYQDFATLMSVCENSTEPRRSEMLHDYMVRFVNEGFAKFVFQKYKEQGRIKELLSAPVECHQQLIEFLAPYDELRWLHEINTKQYHSAYCTLTTCANNEHQSLAKLKNYLSISKLSLLASSCSKEEQQTAIEEIELKLRLIDYQENLIRNCAKGNREELLVPLSADQLIEYYTNGCFDDLTTSMKLNNFLCAMEILSVFYLDCQADSFHHLQLVISSRAVLQNDWQHNLVEDTLDVLKTVFFFELAQAALDKGLDVLRLLPSLQDLSSCDNLQGINQLPSFITIMNSGYEQLYRVTNNTMDDVN